MKKFSLLISLVLTLVAGTAFGQVSDRHLSKSTRADRQCVMYNVAAGTVAGTDGTLYANTINGGVCQVGPCVATSTVGGLLYASSLLYGLTDANADDTLTCSSISISGYDQFGEVVVFTDTTVAETAEETPFVFSKVFRIAVSGCVGATDAGDVVHVRQGARIGLGRILRSWRDVESMCIRDASASNQTLCAFASDGSTADLESDVRLRFTQSGRKYADSSVLVSEALFGGSKVAAADGDEICWRVRLGNSEP